MVQEQYLLTVLVVDPMEISGISIKEIQ